MTKFIATFPDISYEWLLSGKGPMLKDASRTGVSSTCSYSQSETMEESESTSINERFEIIIKNLYGGNKRAFAVAVGVSPTVVENVVGTRLGKPSFDVIERICANANISPAWLVLGKGAITQDMTDAPSNNSSIANVSSDTKVSEFLQPFMEMLKDKDRLLAEQSEEIGKLKEQIRQLTIEKVKHVSDVDTSNIANVG